MSNGVLLFQRSVCMVSPMDGLSVSGHGLTCSSPRCHVATGSFVETNHHLVYKIYTVHKVVPLPQLSFCGSNQQKANMLIPKGSFVEFGNM